MRSFIQIRTKSEEIKTGREKIPVLSVYPEFSTAGKDLMKKGGKFYAILDKDTGMWTTDESKSIEFIDREITRYIENTYTKGEDGNYYDGYIRVRPKLLEISSTGMLKEFNNWMMNIPANHNYIQLDTELTEKDEEVTPSMYRSKRLPYAVKEGSIDSYEKLMSTLYSEDDRRKIEWSIGSVYTGDSKKIEKILVLYGKPGSGKSTILDLVKELFSGYWVAFVASELVSRTHQFATAPFKDNPLLAIQDDGYMMKIDSPVINEIVSHKDVMINEKGKQQYTIRSNAFLFVATNHPVDVQDRRMGIARRLLDVYPSGNKIPISEYEVLVSRLKFEYGAIADHCIKVFKNLGRNFYSDYIPEEMINKTNPVQNFLCDRLEQITKTELWTRPQLYAMFKVYCEESGMPYPQKATEFGEQLKDYFEDFYSFKRIDGVNVHNVYSGLKVKMILGFSEKTEDTDSSIDQSPTGTDWIKFDCNKSVIDELYSDQPAQYPKPDGSPLKSWDRVKTKLKDIDTSKLHWFKLPPNIIKIDFDKRGPDGEKNLEENLKEANKFPKTYAEVSMSGGGIHLYYIYDGDVEKLSSVYDDNIEIKFSYGGRPHRRILTRCNDIPIATISSGLPLKVYKPKIGDLKIENEKHLRSLILKALAKETHADTTSNIDWIYELLERAYISGMSYDVTDMADRIKEFAEHSTHQSKKCVEKFRRMKLKSSDHGDSLKGGMPVIDKDTAEFEGEVRNYIREKLINGRKNPEEAIELISELLKRAYDSGLHYDVSDMRQNILTFVIDSGIKQYVEKLNDFKWKSDEPGTNDQNYDDRPIVFFDCEVFPNFNCICWKYAGENNPVMKMINPTPDQVRSLFQFKLVGFNNRSYDNHILYAIANGYTVYEVYVVSRGIINNEDNAKFREAYNLSYTDIYDFSSKKQSLKEWEIDLDINHQELEFPWDEPVPEECWGLITDYCCNDVIATEATFNYLKEDWMARQILADLADGSVNDSTNRLTTKLVFGDNKKPQLVYTDLATGVQTIGR